ncbi:MAG: HEAT repeat domain-containing protein, partial [Desulfuromonadales bacterium]
MLEERREKLKAALNDPDEGVRATAAESLERLESVLSLDKVRESLSSENRGLRIRAIFALESIDSPKVFPLLLESLR